MFLFSAAKSKNGYISIQSLLYSSQDQANECSVWQSWMRRAGFLYYD